MQAIPERLLQRGQAILDAPLEINDHVRNLHQYPHLWVLACVMDRQIKFERAWAIPRRVAKELGSQEFSAFLQLTPEKTLQIFTDNGLHFYNNDMAKYFYRAIQHIQTTYDGDAARIWSNNPSSATIVRRFLRFDGIGIKIATMAVNILAREFKIPMKDRVAIDISPDRHVRRVFYRLGLIQVLGNELDLLYTAKELNPEYPGIFDLPAFEIGFNYCKESTPLCTQCYMNDICPKVGVKQKK